ncbi:hypothetical protein SISNIDRAFT_546194 [Sistotremastrum niveocremeum HHB9708]|uniref:Zn(2)-C6 fungal-type domain-containing protein n=1 Tax=Sistotremastrum niveocremeum HHB9708 TaxID=1314777 RepID=A0A164ZXB1_9AGAM|nr:hypothetical protein SISNIDRAFT_546194 [Sistotremastrum niveocremeum HHB9708]
MSASPTASTHDQQSHKRRRSSNTTPDSIYSTPPQKPMLAGSAGPAQPGQQSEPPNPSGENSHQPVQVPKRGARACTACRKGKNRCEGEAPCRRCQLSGQPCIFEKPEKKNPAPPVANINATLERVNHLEGQYLVMQSQMIGVQSTLDRILAAVQSQPAPPVQQHNPYSMPPPPPPHPSSSNHYPPENARQNGSGPRSFPPLPGFAPPPHKYATYGIVPSTAPSSDDESEDTLPRSTLNAPIEALQGLANAAAEAAAIPLRDMPRVKKRKRVEPTPRNAFPHVVEKGLVSDQEARELYHIFFSGCHYFIPLFDPAYDTYENLKERTPFCFDAILAVAGKIKSGNGAPSTTFYKCLEEAQGIARSTLFGPVVRKEAVQAMLLLAAWSTSGWLPSGHAMRMALDLGLHRALEKLADGACKHRSEEEERDLVVSSRIWLCLYWFDHQMSMGTGRPVILRDENSIRHYRILLTHPMSSPTDVRLISLIELVSQRIQIYDTLSPVEGAPTHSALAFVRRANLALDKWWADCDELHRQAMDEEHLLRKILQGELYYTKLWLICLALRGTSWDKMPFDQRELAFQAKEAASNCLAMFLNSHTYRAALRYSVHDSLVTATFSGLFLLKMANLFPGDLDLGTLIAQVEQMSQLLSEVAAERYALTLRLMLANLRRKLGIAPMPMQHDPHVMTDRGQHLMAQHFLDPGAIPSGPITQEELGFHWPTPGGQISPSTIPIWLQEGNLHDLSMPINGSDGIFLQGPTTGWATEFPTLMPEAW